MPRNSIDLAGRRSHEAIREIAGDLLDGEDIQLEFRSGRCHRVEGLRICVAGEPQADRFVLELSEYEITEEELFRTWPHLIAIRSTPREKTYWQGY